MKKIIFFLLFSQMVLAECDYSNKIDISDIGTKGEYALKCDLGGTVSFVQTWDEIETKKGNYNSICGSVAAANVIHAYCNLLMSPRKMSKTYFSDITPGIRPDTLAEGLNTIFSQKEGCPNGEWKNYYSTNRWDFMRSLYSEINKDHGNWFIYKKKNNKIKKHKKSPIIVLLMNGEYHHYVVVKDIRGFNPDKAQESLESKDCRVYYNHLGTEADRSCQTFIEMTNSVDDSVLTSVLNEYTHLVFEPYEAFFTKI
jgi:hypothetical protein